ncbi:MAG: YifB family Mg chelatase-like AAA ATPase [Firmicutes bacterium]|nr:YifB family Mg chelatase-like AAA ATPase [Bacillota bacterium]
MYAAVWGAVISDLRARLVRVEVDVNRGLPAFEIVGRPAQVVRESRDRIRAAFYNCGLDFPTRRITVNLAPADFPKAQSFLDLPIAVGILAATGQIKAEVWRDCLFVGELSLAGDLEPIPGSVPIALLTAEHGLNLVCPAGNLTEVEAVAGLRVHAVTDFAGLVCAMNNAAIGWRRTSGRLLPAARSLDPWVAHGIIGGVLVRRCLTIAAAGAHHLALIGPPGVGKTSLAAVLHSLLPPLGSRERLEVAQLYSAVGLPVTEVLQGVPPLRKPHHSLTRAGLLGGGVPIRPGELTLAHRGLLFMDELPLFQRQVLYALREPLEAKQVVLGRSAKQVVLPAAVQLVCAFNLCPCGYHHFHPERCTCSQREVAGFLKPVIGPLADRIDLRLTIARPLWEEQGVPGEQFVCSVQEARAELGRRTGTLRDRLRPEAMKLLRSLVQNRRVSARAYFRLLSVASTISALTGSELITVEHVAEACQYRFEISDMIGGEAGAVV